MAPLRHDRLIKELQKLIPLFPKYADLLAQLIVQVEHRNIDMEQERD